MAYYRPRRRLFTSSSKFPRSSGRAGGFSKYSRKPIEFLTDPSVLSQAKRGDWKSLALNAAGNYVLPHVANAVANRFKSSMSRTGLPGRPKSPSTGIVRIGQGMTGSSFTFRGRARSLSGNDVKHHKDYIAFARSINANSTSFGKQTVTCTLTPDVIGNYGYPGFPQQQHISDALNTLFPSPYQNVDSYQFQITSVKSVMTFHNMDRVTVKLDIYDMTPRRDLGKLFAGSANEYIDPVTTFARALSKYTSGSGSSLSTSLPDVTPYRLPYFNSIFRILKKHTVYLAPGYTHQHTFTSLGHYPCSENRFTDTDTVAFSGLTYSPMVILASGPVRDAVDDSVTLGTPDVIFTNSLQVTYAAKNVATRTYRTTYANFDSSIVMENVRMADAPENIVATDSTGQSNKDTTADVDP